MKVLVTALILVIIPIIVCAQDDDTIQYIHGLPVTGEDTLQQIPQEDLAPADSVAQISPEQLPRELLRTLNGDSIYRGWQKHSIQLDKNTGLYWVHIRESTRVRSYGFNANGKQVSIRERTITSER
jgi:hypothetical protein